MGRAPLHVAAQTGNLESLIRLLDAGAGRAPRDRVSSRWPFCNCMSRHSLELCKSACPPGSGFAYKNEDCVDPEHLKRNSQTLRIAYFLLCMALSHVALQLWGGARHIQSLNIMSLHCFVDGTSTQPPTFSRIDPLECLEKSCFSTASIFD